MSDYEQWTLDEAAQWPGVAVAFEKTSKHRKAVLTFDGASRFVVFPESPSDSRRGVHNHIATMRAELAAMGAVRNDRVKSSRPPSERNPGADKRVVFQREPAPVIADPWEALDAVRNQPIITQTGAYSNISAEDYHRAPNLCWAPSISSSGLKTLLARSPRHFWFNSPLNPERPPEEEKAHFNVGKAAHDLILLIDRWPDHYHVLPEGFSYAKTKAMAEEIAEAEIAREAGKVILTHDQAAQAKACAAAIGGNPLARAALTNGESEVTLVWTDAETGVALRARPDFLPHRRQIIPDLKTAADASPKAFQRAIANHGYAQSAALYMDGIKAIFGEYPSNWLHVVLEKEPPHVVALYELPAEDIERGRWLNRKAVRVFAECLSADRWPGYADEPALLGLPHWERRSIDEHGDPTTAAWSAAA